MLTDSFEAILDALPDGVMVVDAKGAVLYASAEAGRLLACSQGSLVGQSVDTLPGVLAAVRQAERRREYLNGPTVGEMQGRRVAALVQWIDGTDAALNIKLVAIALRTPTPTLVVVSLRERAAS